MAELLEVNYTLAVVVEGAEYQLEVVQSKLDADVLEGHHELLEGQFAIEVFVYRLEGSSVVPVLLLYADVDRLHDFL
jgi:hypothetical protein